MTSSIRHQGNNIFVVPYCTVARTPRASRVVQKLGAKEEEKDSIDIFRFSFSTNCGIRTPLTKVVVAVTRPFKKTEDESRTPQQQATQHVLQPPD